jgi:multidrug efflux pump subunit AcrA (membrane-fusion protein)
MMPAMLRTIVFVAMIASISASETLNALVNASAGFAVAIQQQPAAVQIDLSPAELAEKTISYAKAKTAYFNALRDAVPKLMAIAIGKEERSPEVDRFAESFAVAGEDQEKAADDATLVLLKRFSGNPDVEKARAEFDRAHKVEERFHHDFDGVDFTRAVVGGRFAYLICCVAITGNQGDP